MSKATAVATAVFQALNLQTFPKNVPTAGSMPAFPLQMHMLNAQSQDNFVRIDQIKITLPLLKELPLIVPDGKNYFEMKEGILHIWNTSGIEDFKIHDYGQVVPVTAMETNTIRLKVIVGKLSEIVLHGEPREIPAEAISASMAPVADEIKKIQELTQKSKDGNELSTDEKKELADLIRKIQKTYQDVQAKAQEERRKEQEAEERRKQTLEKERLDNERLQREADQRAAAASQPADSFTTDASRYYSPPSSSYSRPSYSGQR